MMLLLLPSFSVAVSGCGDSRKVVYSVPSLVKSLKDKDPNVRYWAAESLGHFGPEAHVAIPDLINALMDEDKTVRIGAAYALAEMGPPAVEALSTLQEAARDPDKGVRDAALYATKQIQHIRKGKTG
jgi:HEAT repeat protein